jgi:hypothetical protein
MQRFGRTLAAVAAMVAAVVSSAVTDGTITGEEKIQIAVAVTTAILVYVAPNYPGATWIKTAVAMTLAVLSAASAALSGGFSRAEVINIVIAGIGVVAVGAAPSASTPEESPSPRLSSRS